MTKTPIYLIAVIALSAATAQGSVIVNSFTTSTLMLNEGETLVATVSISSSHTGSGEGLEQFVGQVNFHTISPAYGEIANLNGVATTLSAACDPYIMLDDGIYQITFAGYATERIFDYNIGELVGQPATDFSITGPTITVHNVAPTITIPQTDLQLDLNYGGLTPFSAWAIDPGINDVLTYAWDLNGDGVFTDATGATTDMLDLSSWTPMTYAAKLRVDDGDGGVSYQSFNLTLIPEPTAGCLAALALGMLATRRKRSR